MGQYNIIFRQLEVISNKSLNLFDVKKRELKNNYDYGNANACGKIGITIQGATTLFLANIKRIIKLEEEKNKNIDKLKENLLAIVENKITVNSEKNKKLIKELFSEEVEINKYLEILK